MKLIIPMIAVLLIAHTARAEQRYFGYSEVPTLDGQRHHITDPKTGRPGIESVCLVWERGWRSARGYMNVEAQRVTRWYTGWAVQIDAQQPTATLSNFSAPMIEDTPQGRRRVGPDQAVPRLTVTIPLTLTRPPGCTDRWVAMWTEQNRQVARPAPNPGTRGRSDSTANAGGAWRPEMGRGQTDPNYCKDHAPSRPGQPNVQNFYKCWAYQHGATEQDVNPRVDGFLPGPAPSSDGKPCTVGNGVDGYRQGWVRGGFCQVN